MSKTGSKIICHAALISTIYCITEMISTNCRMSGDFSDVVFWFLTPLPLFPLCQTQPAFTCSKLTIETLEQGVKYVQS